MKLSRIALACAAAYSLWLGSEGAHDVLLFALDAAAQLEVQGPAAVQARVAASGGTGFELPPMWRVEGSVGILEISGPLMTGSSGWMRLFGVVGYDDIRQAADELVSQKSVKSILLHVNSPGGMAAGCEDCSAHLKALSSIKPMMTYSDTVMASGGYWLGSVGKPIMAGSTAVLGSIGVLITHVDVSKANEMAGRKVTVIRIGEEKQLANPNEPLTDKAKAHLESMGDQLYSVFRSNVAANLGVDETKFDKTMGRGREFMGQQAVDAGLAQQVATFDQALTFAKSVDTTKLNSQNPRNRKDSGMKATLSAAYLVQIAAGVAIASLDMTVAAASMSAEAPDAEAQTLLRAQAIEVEAALKSGKYVTDATAPLTAKVTELTASLGVVNTEVVGLRTTNASLVSTAAKAATDLTAADAIVMGSLQAMSVALKQAEPKADLKGTELITEHARVAVEFTKKFPTQRVSAAPVAEKPASEVTSEALPHWVLVAQRNAAARNAA